MRYNKNNKWLEPVDSLQRYPKLNLLNLKGVEEEIDLLIEIAGDNPSYRTIKEVEGLIKVAKALGTKRSW